MSREEVGCDLDERGGEAPWVLVHVLFEVTVEVLEDEVDRPVAHHLVQQTGVELKCFKLFELVQAYFIEDQKLGQRKNKK